MKKETIIDWDKDTGTARCILVDSSGNSFYGEAKCHPDDMDMMSEKTGYEIAYQRAVIKSLKYYKKNDIEIPLKTLKHFLSTINSSKQFNPKAYEVKRLYHQIQVYEDDLISMREFIAETKEDLQAYIQKKDEFYAHVRKNRKAKMIELEHNNS